MLAQHFANLYATRYNRPAPKFSERVLKALSEYAFPGNVRELEHWIESAVVLSLDGNIHDELLPNSRRGEGSRTAVRDDAVALPLGLSLDDAMRRYIEATLRAHDNNKTEAARALQVGRNTIGRLLKPRK
jgi:Nif-specific regulatory protein